MATAITVRELVTVLGFRTDQDKIDRYDAAIDRVSKKMVDLGRKATLFVSLPIAAAGVAMLKMASDAEETESKFRTVFAEVGDEAQGMAETLRNSFGLSRKASQQLLGDTGDLLTGFGFAGKEALSLSMQVNTLAVDLASFTNFAGGAEGASQALTKALLGERESVKQLGIAILEKDVQEEVAIMRSEGQRFATERQAKAWATLRIAMRQSKNAVGDFARTQFQLANQFRTLKGRVADVAVSFGKVLIPFVTKLVGHAIKLANWIDGLSGNTKNFLLILAGLTAILPPIIWLLGTMAGVTAAAALPWIGIGLAILAVIVILALFISDFLAWKNGQASFLGLLLGDYEKFGQGISDFFDGLFTFLFHLWEGHWDEVIAGIDHFVKTVKIMLQDMAKDMEDIPILGALVKLIGGTIMLAEEAGSALGSAVGGLGVQRPETLQLSAAQRAQLQSTGSVNIHQTTNVQVPVGTTPDQAHAIARVAKMEVQKELQASSRQMINSSPVSE